MASDEVTPKHRRSPWLWVSVVLAVVAVGALVWGLAVKSDRDSAQQQLADTQQELAGTQDELSSTKKELDSSQQEASAPEEDKNAGGTVVTVGALAGMKALYDDLADELGATQEDLATTQQDLAEADKKAEKASQDAAAAEQKAKEADNETDKAKAEADQAKAEAEATKSKAAIAADCAKAYFGALGDLFEGDNPEDQAAAVREKLSGITGDCKAALGST
jgi:chromosome segregation ATPase